MYLLFNTLDHELHPVRILGGTTERVAKLMPELTHPQ